MENTIEGIRRSLKILDENKLRIAIGLAVAVAIGVPLYLYKQKGINDFNEVWNRIYQINYELAVAEQDGPGKKTEALEGAISEYSFLKDKLSTTDATPWLILELGNAQYKAGRYDEAILTYREFITRFDSHPLAPVIRQSLGYVLEEKGQLEDALEQFKKIAKDPEAAYIRAQVKLDAGRCYEKLGQLNTAVTAYREVIDSYPESSYARMAEYRLEDID